MRLEGPTLKTIRRLVENSPGAALVRRRLYRDLGIDALLDLPAEARRPLAVDPGPLAQQTDRGWESADYDPPTSPDHRLTAAKLRRAYTEGDVTPTRLLSRIETRIRNRDFGASIFSPFQALDFQRARKAAEASTRRYRDGAPKGPLDGIPVPVKDHYLMKGVSVDAGSTHVEERPDEDAHVVEVLRRAGALVYATTKSTEWGMDPCGFSPHVRMPRNVYDSKFAAGGSSTGTAVAVGLGFAPVGIGSDGGGSIRIPSALNGLFGLKPTYVRIGRTGDLFASSSVSVTGPIGASTTDLVDLMTSVAAADDPLDPASRWSPDQPDVADRWRAALGRGVDGCRIGVPAAEWATLDASLANPSLEALRRLEHDGAELVDVEVPLLEHGAAIGVLTIGRETLANLQDIDVDHFGDSLRLSLAMLRTVEATDFMAARRTRVSLRHSLREVLDDVDLLALPTTGSTAPEYPAELGAGSVVDDRALGAMTRYNFAANLTGLPAGSVPVGRHRGLPFGLQFVGGAWDEASVLAAMAHAQRQGWTRLPAPPDVTRPARTD